MLFRETHLRFPICVVRITPTASLLRINFHVAQSYNPDFLGEKKKSASYLETNAGLLEASTATLNNPGMTCKWYE